MTVLWTEKYRPSKVAEVVGNKQAVAQFLEWMDGWMKGKPSKKAVLLHGPAGVGKTSLVIAFAKEKGYEVIEMNASDFRTRENVEKIVGAASAMQSLTSPRKIILVDEVDGLDARADTGAVSTLVQIISQTLVPIVLIANDPWDPKLAPIREASTMIKFSKIPKPSLAAHLKKIAAAEKFTISEEGIRRIVESSEGDLRSAINDLQMTASAAETGPVLGLRDREKGVFDAMATVFHAKTFTSAVDSLNNLDVEPSEFFRWILDNAPNQLSPKDLAEAFEYLSKADLYLQRINMRQAWHYLRYAAAYMTAGVSLSRRTTPPKYVQFSYPESIKFLGQTKAVREKIENISAKIAEKLHMSTRKAKTQALPYIKIMMARNGEALAEYFGFSSDEVEFLKGGEVRKKRGRGSG
ncbi:MAG: replication factor C large subunit [Candidatus Caldarchaeum sp.]|nr:replication factor C large subunit [Candidatus Caldarchaeum sp.]MDW8062866.1 replication factor C large subunit [Candidatus Caldarchaeum sp.]